MDSRLFSSLMASPGRDLSLFFKPKLSRTSKDWLTGPQELELGLEAWRHEMPGPAWPSKRFWRKVPIDGAVYEINI